MDREFNVFEGPEAFREYAEAWDALVTANDAGPLRLEAAATSLPGFFLRSRWLNPWAKQCWVGTSVFLGALMAGKEWSAGIPIQLRRGKIGRFEVTKYDFAGAPWIDGVGIPATESSAREEIAPAILRWACENNSEWNISIFNQGFQLNLPPPCNSPSRKKKIKVLTYYPQCFCANQVQPTTYDI